MVGHIVDLIESGSKGRIWIKVFPDMQLGGQPWALVNQVENGVVDLVFTLLGYTGDRFPVLLGLELPFLGIASAAITTRLALDFYDEYAYVDFTGFRPISMTDTSGLQITGRKVSRIEGLAGLKIRVGSRQIATMLKELGAEPV